MKRLANLLIVCAICGGMAADAAANIREERPNAVGGELLGRGIILTLNYERYFDPHFGVGAGLMTIGTDEGGVFIMPLYVNYLSGDKHNLFASIGETILGGGGSISDYETASFTTFALGYQFNSDSGFYVRPFFTFLNILDIEDGNTGVWWPGLAMGGSF